MYDPATTALAVEAASRAQGWDLQYYPSDYVNACIAHLKTLYDPEAEDRLDLKQRPQGLLPDEYRFVQNERRLCGLDFWYYGRQYARIISKEKDAIPFNPNVAQSMVLDVWGQMEARALPISMQQLKARQLGVSTLTEIAVGHRVQFHVNTNAVVASADPQKSVKMARMIKYNWDQQPWWLMPKMTRQEKNMPAEFGELNSSLLIQAGNQFTGIARGDTPNVFHGSEICEWPDAGDLIDSALMRAMHETPNMFRVLESTALGRGNWWHKTWLLSKSQWDHGRAQLCPMFLPWFVGVDLYPTPTWLRSRPIPANWIPKDVTIRHADRAAAYVRANPLLRKHLAKGNNDWRMPREQMWFYEVERDTAIAKNTLNKFLQEMPADDTEAFQSTNISAVGSEIILDYRERTKDPLAVYTIVGDGIPESLVVSRRQWDYTQPMIPIKVNTLLRSTETYQFVPLKFEGYSNTDPALRLFIYGWPEEGQTYGIGVDTSEGLGQDRSVMEVLQCATPTTPDIQVAEFASEYIKATQLWPMALALGCFYSVFKPSLGHRAQCRLAIECRGNGESVQLELKKRGWSNFHPWLRYYNRAMAKPADANVFGIYTVQWFRSQMMDMLLTGIDEGTLDISSPWFVEELEALEKDEHKQSLKAAFGEHDDRVMAFGFALFSLHVLDVAGRQYSRRMRSNVAAPAPIIAQHPTWMPGIQGSSKPFRGVVPLEGRVPSGAGRLGRYTNITMPKGYR